MSIEKQINTLTERRKKMKKKIICPRCKGNGYLKVKKEVQWPQKEEIIVVQCPMCNSEGEIEDVDRKTN